MAAGHDKRKGVLVAWTVLLGLLIAAPTAPARAAPAAPAEAAATSVPRDGTATGFAIGPGDLLSSRFVATLLQQAGDDRTAEALRARREAKRAQLAPPRQTGVEAGLAWLEEGHWLQRIRAGWNGFLPTLGGFPSGSGQAFGVLWTKTGVGVRYPDERTANRVDLRGAAAFSLRGYYLGLFEVGLRRIGGAPVNASFHYGYQHNANESFYGFGPDSRVEDRISFAETVNGLGTVVWWQAPSWFYVGAGVTYRDTDVGEGEDAFAPGPDFDFDRVPGFTEQVEFLTYDGFVQIDWRNDGNSYRGGLYAVRYSDWQDRDTDAFSFRRLAIELQQYVPFLMNKRVIALRARTVMTDTDAGRQVPFYLMPTLGGTRDLRGYNYARFRDRNMILLNAEYRAEIWLAMDLALFVDAGKVVADRSDINFDDLSTNYGIGLRLKTTLSTFLRADFAFGGEGFHTAITFDNVYDTTPLFSRILRTVQ